MDGPHDVGGRSDFGPIDPEKDEPLFHAEWEKRALGVTLACAALGHWTIDESRHARENLHPGDYYSSSYYEIWIKALERLLQSHGEVSSEELASGAMRAPGNATEKRLSPDKVAAVLARGGPTDRAVETTPRFSIGDEIRTINTRVNGHTRLPAYARDKIGMIEAIHEAHVFPDTNAHDKGEYPQTLYTVTFPGTTLWGKNSDPAISVSINAWESYLEPA